MNVERTIELILERQAKIVEQQFKTDRRVDAIAKLVRMGMKTLVGIGKAQKQNEPAQGPDPGAEESRRQAGTGG